MKQYRYVHEYLVSRKIASEDYPFYALIMAAMRQADGNNIEKLKTIFPDVYEELLGLYNTPMNEIKEE